MRSSACAPATARGTSAAPPFHFDILLPNLDSACPLSSLIAFSGCAPPSFSDSRPAMAPACSLVAPQLMTLSHLEVSPHMLMQLALVDALGASLVEFIT